MAGYPFQKLGHYKISLFAFLLIFHLHISYGSRFNPKVKITKQELRSDEVKSSGSSESTAKKTANCAGVNCMPQPVPAPGSPECRPRYDGDACCPTWICASDELLAKSLFDKDNNWNVEHDYEHNLFDVDDNDNPENFPPEAMNDDAEKFERYAAKGKLDNTHNRNFISRMQHEDEDKTGPSIADNYANYKRKVHEMNSRRHNARGINI